MRQKKVPSLHGIEHHTHSADNSPEVNRQDNGVSCVATVRLFTKVHAKLDG